MTTVETVPFWDEDPEAWDRVVLGTHVLPGRASCKVTRGKKKDKKAAPGKQGSTVTGQGFEDAKVEITWTLFPAEGDDPAQYWRTSLEILAALEDKNVKESALDIIHPACTARGVHSVTVDTIDGPDEAGDGTRVVRLSCTEHIAPPEKKKGTGKTGAGTGSSKPFDATWDFGNGVIGEVRIVEGPKGSFRDAKTGKKMDGLLLDVFSASKKTPLEEEADKKEFTDYSTPGSVTATPTSSTSADPASDFNNYAPPAKPSEDEHWP